MAEFRINYESAVAQASEMSGLARDLGDRIAALEDLLDRVRCEWQGPESDACQKQLIMLIADMKTTRYNMSSVSTTIRNVADRIRREDEQPAKVSG